MIVEDDPISASAMRTILSRRGYDVLLAGTVAEAFAMLEHNTPSAVVLDLMLPDGDGIVVLQKLRADGSSIRVAVCDTTRLDAVRRLNPAALLQKPIDLRHLLKAIEYVQ